MKGTSMKRIALWLASIALTAFVGTAAAQEESSYTNLALVKGILFLNSEDAVKPEGVPALQGIVVKDVKVLEREDFQIVARQYLGKPLDTVSMREMQRDIVLYCRAHRHPIVDVIYVEQDVSNGVLQVVVLEGKVAARPVTYVKDAGPGKPPLAVTNGWTKPQFVTDRVRLREGHPIDMRVLQRDLDWLNRNPLRKVDVLFRPGAKIGYADVILEVREERQWQAHLGYDNTGTRFTDFNRINAGVAWGKAFGLTDHFFTYDFIADPALDHLRAHTASYAIPLPWRHELRFMGYYLDVEGDIGSGIRLEGANYQASFRYAIPLPYIGKYQQEVAFGLDFKSADNNLNLGVFQAHNAPTEIFQFALGYSGIVRDFLGETRLGAQFYFSPGGVTSKNTDAAFAQSRLFAESQYVYGRLQAERQTRLPANFTWLVRIGAQRADGNLLPTEQFGLGGYATVRGYHEREVNTDNGWNLSQELRTPEFSPLANWCKWAWVNDKMQFLGFFDYGAGKVINSSPSDVFTSRELAGAGFGLRYTARKNLELRFDYGWQLKRYKEIDYASTWHLAAMLKF
ncbi:MAG: ShlB/FhaC/HecB family hemolysin secretion/activation protein [Verrucomicrobia bacterium]|nr:ShlB/FhaC/HecB family hemolysin secretion/activation protein [Verrucomicrobiota bacterium]